MAIDGVSGVSGVSDVGPIETPQFEPEALPASESAAEPAGFSTTDDFTPAEEAAPVDLTGGAAEPEALAFEPASQDPDVAYDSAAPSETALDEAQASDAANATASAASAADPTVAQNAELQGYLQGLWQGASGQPPPQAQHGEGDSDEVRAARERGIANGHAAGAQLLGPNQVMTMDQLAPLIQMAAASTGADPKIIAAIIAQESGKTGIPGQFVNQLVHDDGQGTGLTGLDPRGLLPAFEQATGLVAGPPEDRHALPPAQQIQFLAQTIASTGNNMEAAAIWHAGPRGTNTQAGREYVDIIKGWISGTDPRFGPFVANLFK